MENKDLENYQGILTRIRIVYGNGNEVGYIYGLNAIRALVKKENQKSNSTLLTIDDVFTFSDIDLKITKIHTRFYNETDVDFMNYGMTMSTIGELQLPFNFEIIYEVIEI